MPLITKFTNGGKTIEAGYGISNSSSVQFELNLKPLGEKPISDPFEPYLNGDAPKIVKDLGNSTTGNVVVNRFVLSSRQVDGVYEDVYAVIARPVENGNCPGLLYLHGGDGYAEEATAVNWAKNGYIAMVLDEPGIADPTKVPNSSGPWVNMAYGANRFIAQPDITNSTIFSAVAAELNAFKLLSAQPGIIKDRIGITGISWGGYSTTMLAGLLGDKVCAAYSIYGCGYYDKGTIYNSELDKMAPSDRDIWLKYLDAGRRASGIKAKYFIAAAVRDHFFWPSAVNATLDNISGYKNQVFAPITSHSLAGLPGSDTSMIYMDYYLKDKGLPFPVVNIETITSQPDGSREIIVNVDASTDIQAVKLYYSLPTNDWETRPEWKAVDAKPLKNNRFSVSLTPAQVTAKVDWYVTATDSRPVTASTKVLC